MFSVVVEEARERAADFGESTESETAMLTGTLEMKKTQVEDGEEKRLLIGSHLLIMHAA